MFHQNFPLSLFCRRASLLPQTRERGEYAGQRVTETHPSTGSSDREPNPRRRLLAKVLLAVFSILVSFLAAELLLRRYYPAGETIFQLDQRYLYRIKPNSHYVYRFSSINGGGRLLVSYNSEGRRGAPVSMTRPRVLVYGDSFIEAAFSPIEQTFVWQLEQKLKRTLSPAPQVVNCGVVGYGPDQESLVMEDEIDRLKPELVIVAIYAGNDFGDLMRNKIYKLDDQEQLKKNDYTIDRSVVNDALFNEQFSRLYSIRLMERASDKLVEKFEHQETSDEYMQRWLRESVAEYKEYVIDGNNGVSNFFEDHYDADVSLTPNSPSSQYKRMLMDRVIEKMKRVTAARGVPLMLVIIPAPFDVVDNYTVTVDERKYPEYRRSELTDVVEGIAKKHQLPYVNLFTPFREHGSAPLYYVFDNDHWKPEAQQLAASLVAEYILQQRLLDANADTTHRAQN